ncbi:MAG: pantothenate kinase [Bacteroidetes bacterium]|nr:MAG: pantothenate kinase [Bacteroidota bacterium]
MNLVIDVGNTLVKIAIFDRQKIIHHTSYSDIQLGEIDKMLELFPDIDACIIGSVRTLPESFTEEISKKVSLYILGPESKLPVGHQYKTFDTLGADRIAGVVAANHIYPGKNILLIETGTCITYDFIDDKGIYQGGGISPGIHLRMTALHNFTDKLPLVEPVGNPALIGNTTEGSIQSGVINGVKAEVWGIIALYERDYENLIIILSGGNLDYFDKNLKNNIFAVPNIVLTGLNIIFEFNDKN